jgi:hypothetical protein
MNQIISELYNLMNKYGIKVETIEVKVVDDGNIHYIIKTKFESQTFNPELTTQEKAVDTLKNAGKGALNVGRNLLDWQTKRTDKIMKEMEEKKV